MWVLSLLQESVRLIMLQHCDSRACSITIFLGKSQSYVVLQGEKWDSLTRHWSDSGYILDQIKLFLVDEVRSPVILDGVV
jgi:hypothetical protein